MHRKMTVVVDVCALAVALHLIVRRFRFVMETDKLLVTARLLGETLPTYIVHSNALSPIWGRERSGYCSFGICFSCTVHFHVSHTQVVPYLTIQCGLAGIQACVFSREETPLLRAVIKQGKSEGFDSCDRPSNLTLDSNRRFSARVTLKFDRWPRKTIGTSSILCQALCVIPNPSMNSNRSYSPETLNSATFCPVWPWNLMDDLGKQ